MDDLKEFIKKEIMMAENSEAFFDFSQGYAEGCKAILKHIEDKEAKAKEPKPMPNFGFDGQF